MKKLFLKNFYAESAKKIKNSTPFWTSISHEPMHVFRWFLVKCYPLDTQKPEPKFFDNSYIFHNGGHLELRKKMRKIYCLISWKNKGKLFFGYNFGSSLALRKNIAWKFQINTVHRSWDVNVEMMTSFAKNSWLENTSLFPYI